MWELVSSHKFSCDFFFFYFVLHPKPKVKWKIFFAAWFCVKYSSPSPPFLWECNLSEVLALQEIVLDQQALPLP